MYDRKQFKIHGKEICWRYYQQVFLEDSKRDKNSGLRACPKLTKEHVYPTNMAKMRVYLAVQVFSKSMADGMQAYHDAELKEKMKFEKKYPTEKFVAKFEGCEATIAFTRKINRMFDILNSRNIDGSLTLNCSAFEELEEIIKWLESWESEIRQEAAPFIEARDKAVVDVKKQIRDRIKKKTITDPADKKTHCRYQSQIQHFHRSDREKLFNTDNS